VAGSRIIQHIEVKAGAKIMASIKTILCVEDDRFIGEMYARSLRNKGYEVDWAITGSDARQMAIAKSYDLILLDIMLPEETGVEILEYWRNKNVDRIPHSRVIILTNFEQDDDSKAAMQARADAYLIKADITPRKLIELIAGMERI
jgi:DNA-binding response OmpR family regulator